MKGSCKPPQEDSGKYFSDESSCKLPAIHSGHSTPLHTFPARLSAHHRTILLHSGQNPLLEVPLWQEAAHCEMQELSGRKKLQELL